MCFDIKILFDGVDRVYFTERSEGLLVQNVLYTLLQLLQCVCIYIYFY